MVPMADFFADFFAADYQGGAFEFPGSAHLAALGTLVVNLHGNR